MCIYCFIQWINIMNGTCPNIIILATCSNSNLDVIGGLTFMLKNVVCIRCENTLYID